MPYQVTLGPAGSGATFENDAPGGQLSAWVKFINSSAPGITPQEWEVTLLGGAKYCGESNNYNIAQGTWATECTKLIVRSEAGAFTGIPYGEAGGNTTCLDLTQDNDGNTYSGPHTLYFNGTAPDVLFQDVQIKAGRNNGQNNEQFRFVSYSGTAEFDRCMFTDWTPGISYQGNGLFMTDWSNSGIIRISNSVFTNNTMAANSNSGSHKFIYNYRTGMSWEVYNNTFYGNDYTDANNGDFPVRYFHGGGSSAQLVAFNNVIDLQFQPAVVNGNDSVAFSGNWATSANVQFNACSNDSTDIGPVYPSYQYPRVLGFPDSQYNGNFDWAKVSGRVESDGTFNTLPGLGVDKQVFCRTVSPGVYYWIAWHDGPNGEFWYCGTSSTDPRTWIAASATGTTTVALLAGTGQTVNGGEGPQSAYVAWFSNGSDIYTDIGVDDLSQKPTSPVILQGPKLVNIPPADLYGTLRDESASLWDLGATTYSTAVNDELIECLPEPQIRSSGSPSTEVGLIADSITAALRSSGGPSIEQQLETCGSAACPVIVRSSGSPTVVNADALLACTAEPKVRSSGVASTYSEGALGGELWAKVRSSGTPELELNDASVRCDVTVRSSGAPTLVIPDGQLACTAYAVVRSEGSPEGSSVYVDPPAGRLFIVLPEIRMYVPTTRI